MNEDYVDEWQDWAARARARQATDWDLAFVIELEGQVEL